MIPSDLSQMHPLLQTTTHPPTTVNLDITLIAAAKCLEMARSYKCDIEPHRADIERRTTEGESCEAIASALRANGVDVSAKTISRYRVGWGIRQRREPATKGRKCLLI